MMPKLDIFGVYSPFSSRLGKHEVLFTLYQLFGVGNHVFCNVDLKTVTMLQTTLVTLIIAVVLVSGLVVLSGLRRLQRDRANAGAGRAVMLAEPAGGRAPLPLTTDNLDVEAELHFALSQYAAQAAARHVSFVIAIQPHLVARSDPATFRSAVAEIVLDAIDTAEGSSVLVTAMRVGGHITLMVTDDRAGDDALRRESNLRPCAEMIALRGGRLTVEAQPGAGTSVILRLASALDRPANDAAELAADQRAAAVRNASGIAAG
jgi:hypothetical protein